MKKKTIEDITQELKEKQNALDAEISDLNLKIEMQDAAIREHEREMAAASDAGNVGEYVASKQERRKAADEKEMYVSRLDKLTRTGVITEEEYNGILKDLRYAMGDKTAEITKEVNDNLRGLDPLDNELRENVEKTNSAMETAFIMCYPGEHPKKKDGTIATPERYRGHVNTMLKIKRATGRDDERDY